MGTPETESLSVEEVRRFIRTREIELLVSPPAFGGELYLRASYDGYGWYFGITFHDVDFVCIPGGVELRDIHLGQLSEFAEKHPKWKTLLGQSSGPALLIETSEEYAGETEFIIIADRIEFTRGEDWPSATKSGR